MPTDIDARAFIVGCPRSGTTLLQSMLAAHPQIVSFPESHFFTRTISGRPWLRRLGIASRMARPRFRQFLKEIDQEELSGYLPRSAVTVNRFTEAFVAVLDDAARRQGARCWVEKTPRHLHYLSYIEDHVERAHFIHMLRNGEDTIASLYEVTQSHAHPWGGPRTLDECIDRWRKDIQISIAYLDRPNHLATRYEALTREPRETLKRICYWLGLTYDDAMVRSRKKKAEALILEEEAWKAGAVEAIGTQRSRKFERVFTEQQQDYVRERIADVRVPDVRMPYEENGSD